MKSKLKNKEWISFICNYDAIFFLESWVEEGDWKSIERWLPKDYKWEYKAAEKIGSRGRASGGIVTGVKNGWMEDTKKENNMKGLYERNIIVGSCKLKIVAVYVNKNLNEVCKEINQRVYENEYEAVIIGGDWNARIGNLNGYSINENGECEERKSKDTLINREGREMMKWIEEGSWNVLNGCNKGDKEGEWTYCGVQGRSVIDYILVDEKGKKYVEQMCVGDRPESDHFPVEVELELDSSLKSYDVSRVGLSNRIRYKWNMKIANDLTKFINEECWTNVRSMNQITEWMRNKLKRRKHTNQRQKYEYEWNEKCEEKKKQVRNVLKKVRDGVEKWEQYERKKKEWRGAMNECKREHMNEELNRIRQLKSEKEIWEYIKKESDYKEEPLIKVDNWKAVCMLKLDGIETTNKKQRNKEGIGAYENANDIGSNEVKDAIKKLKNGKAAGTDGMTAEMWKCANDSMIEATSRCMNDIWKGKEEMPNDWRLGEIVPIYKKGDKNNIENYRGVTMSNIEYKIYANILLAKLEKEVEQKYILKETQMGFRKGMGTVDNLMVLNYVVQNELRKKGKVYLLFLDLEGAYDSVNRKTLIDILIKLGVSKQLVEAIKSIYEETVNRVRVNEKVSDSFETRRGLKQGCPLSPILFNIYIANLEETLQKGQAGGIVLGKKKIWSLGFADDIVCMAKTKNELSEMIERVGKFMLKRDLKVSTCKTKIMICSNSRISRGEEFRWSGSKIECVKNFKYLGVIFSRNGSWNEHVKYIVKKTQVASEKLKWVWAKKYDESLRVRMTIMETCIRNIVLYGCEIWGVKERVEVERIQVKYLKRMLSLEKSTPDYIVLQELNKWKVWLLIAKKLAKLELKAKQDPDRLINEIIRLAGTSEGGSTAWGRDRKLMYERVGWSLNECEEWKKRGEIMLRRFEEILKDVEQQERQEKIQQSKYNTKYKDIQVLGRKPKYLMKDGCLDSKRLIARFRCGNEERMNKYWLKNEKRVCMFCEFESDKWEHWSECRRSPWNDEQKQSAKNWRRMLDESGTSEEWMRKIVSARKEM